MITVNKTSLQTKTEPETPCLSMRLREAAQALGICERTLWVLTDKGEIPVVKLGKMRLYPVDVLRDWLRQKAQTTSPEK